MAMRKRRKAEIAMGGDDQGARTHEESKRACFVRGKDAELLDFIDQEEIRAFDAERLRATKTKDLDATALRMTLEMREERCFSCSVRAPDLAYRHRERAFEKLVGLLFSEPRQLQRSEARRAEGIFLRRVYHASSKA